MREERLNNGTVVLCSADAPVGEDGLCLAAFVRLGAKDSLLELCAGCGFISLKLRDGGFRGPITAVELNEEATALFKASVARSGFENVEVLCTDARHYTPVCKVDAVVCNPPYFAAGDAGTGTRGISRHELCFSLEEAAKAAKRALKENGRLYVCYPPSRLQHLMCTLQGQGFSVKRLRLVRHRADKDPWLALVQANYRGGEGLVAEPDLIARAADGSYTEEMKRKLEGGMPRD